ncbi:MAG: cycR2 [Holophagaceae bacterium]|nr:cycR2 [Holophagaceae bacterium]
MVTTDEILKAGILIVDDQEADVAVVEGMLRHAGYGSVTSTLEPGEVSGLHASHNYDLILLDLEMPTRDGFQVMKDLQAVDPEGYLPVLILSARPEHRLRALESGAKDFVSKPFDLAEVLARVRNMLEVRLLHAEARTYRQDLERRNEEMQKALDNVKLLSGLLPICAWCKKIRDDQGYWNGIEQFIREHSEAEFTHGICPECTRKCAMGSD